MDTRAAQCRRQVSAISCFKVDLPHSADAVEKLGYFRFAMSPSARGHLSDGAYEDHRLRDELGQFAKVLGRGREVELIAGAVWSSQSQSVEP
jgi:hypothetical protein